MMANNRPNGKSEVVNLGCQDYIHCSDSLNVYYKKLFPYSQFYKWLSYGNSKCCYLCIILYIYPNNFFK